MPLLSVLAKLLLKCLTTNKSFKYLLHVLEHVLATSTLSCQSSVMVCVRWNLLGKKWVYFKKFMKASPISSMCVIERDY